MSVDEYRLALAGKPDDRPLKRGLDRARKKAGSETSRRVRAAQAKAREGAGGGEAAPAETTDDAAKSAPPSAPAEPAADEQK